VDGKTHEIQKLYEAGLEVELRPRKFQNTAMVNIRCFEHFTVCPPEMMRKWKQESTTPAPDPVVSDPLGAYALPPQATDGLVQQDIDPPAEY